MFNAEKIKNGCVAWIRDFFEKNGKGCNAVLGISGGKDSSVAAALCVEALGKDRVIGVLMPSGVASEDMPALYAGAEMLLCTSRHEGFSMPIIEAMSVGIPVIAVHGTCHEEAGGEAAIYVSPDDSEELADNIKIVRMNDVLRHRMVAAGREQVSRFRPEVVAYNILNCYKRIGVDLTELRR